MKPNLYLLELVIASLCVGLSTLVFHNIFGVMEVLSFAVSFVAVAIGLAVFWTVFVPNMQTTRQRTLGFVVAMIIGMGAAPAVVQPAAATLVIEHSESTELFERYVVEDYSGRQFGEWEVPRLTPAQTQALKKKLLTDGFTSKPEGRMEWFSRRHVRVQIIDHFQKDRCIGSSVHIGWHFQCFWFQYKDKEAEGANYFGELERWRLNLKE